MIPAAVMARLAKLNLTPEQAEIVAEMLSDVEVATESKANAAIDARRANDRDRKQRQRDHEKSRDITGTHETERDGEDEPSSLPPKNNNQTPISPTSSSSLRSDEPRARDLRFEFEQDFWPAYPHKVGKPAALRAFGPARKRASLEDILAGLGRYKRDKPPDRAWCNPATFLNQDRFADEPAAPNARAGPNGHETMGSVMMDILGSANGRSGNERFDENPGPGFPARVGR